MKGQMKIAKVISKSKNGRKMEVIGVDNDGVKRTLHVHKKASEWLYSIGVDARGKGKRTFGIIQEKGE